MHCSSCEPLLDRYLEGTLPPRMLADIRAHIESCPKCKALLDEVKVVDALLFTTKVPPLPENFTFAVMAEVQSMPALRERAPRIWSFLALYSAAAWVAAVIAIALSGAGASVFTTIGNGIAFAAARIGAIGSIAPHDSPTLVAFGFFVLVLDAVLAAGVGVLYFGVRPRLAAAFATSRRAGHD